MIVGRNHYTYYLPCGDLCESTCLDQADIQPVYEVRPFFRE